MTQRFWAWLAWTLPDLYLAVMFTALRLPLKD